MKNFGIKISKKLVSFLMGLLIIMAMAGMGISIYGLVSYNQEIVKYIYLAIGFILIPVEFLMTGEISGVFATQNMLYMGLICEVVLWLFIILIFMNMGKMFNGRYSTKSRYFSAGITIIVLIAFSAVFIYSGVLMLLNMQTFENAIESFAPVFLNQIKTNFGFNLLMIKELVLCGLGALICPISIIAFIVGMSHKTAKTKILTSIGFYSGDYQESVSQNVEVKQDSVVQESKEMPEATQSAKNLVKKIMQLEELKNKGKISNSDYTRLRDKAIKRYKA